MGNLPNAVQQQADLADAMQQQLAAPQLGQPVGQQEPPQSEPAPTEPVATPVDEPQVTVEQSTAVVPQLTEEDFAKMQSRYDSLKGKYNKEVPRLYDEVNELKEQTKRLVEENARLRDEATKLEQSRQALTEKDVETFGEDWIDVIRRGAQEESAKYARRAQELENKVRELEGKLEQTQTDTRTAREKEFMRALTAAMPDWQQTDTDPGFSEWLNGVDPNFGIQRKSAFVRAVQAYDVGLVTRIYQMYRAGKVKPNPLATQVAPAHRAGTQPKQTAQPQARVFKESEVAAFYQNARRGKYTDEQVAQIEKEIFDAAKSGRVLHGV